MAFNVNNMLEVVLEFEVEKDKFMEFPCIEMCTLTELNMISAVNKVPKGSAVTVNGLQLFNV